MISAFFWVAVYSANAFDISLSLRSFSDVSSRSCVYFFYILVTFVLYWYWAVSYWMIFLSTWRLRLIVIITWDTSLFVSVCRWFHTVVTTCLQYIVSTKKMCGLISMIELTLWSFSGVWANSRTFDSMGSLANLA